MDKLTRPGYWLGVHFTDNGLKGFVVGYGRDEYKIITGATNGNSWGKYTKASLRERLAGGLHLPATEIKSFTDQQEFAAWLAS